MIKDNEQIYDEQINPLMAKIIAICKEHQIPMLATFQYCEPDEERGGFCTTRIPVPGENPCIKKALDVINPPAFFAAYTITTRDPAA